MQDRRQLTVPRSMRRKHCEELKDEVYRHMFRLEERRPGAERDLAIALLRAWVTLDSELGGGNTRQWLKKICPICLAMIEAAPSAGESGARCAQ